MPSQQQRRNAVRDIRHARDDEQNAEHARKKARLHDEQSERQEPKPKEYLHRENAIGMQAEEEHPKRLPLRAGEGGYLAHYPRQHLGCHVVERDDKGDRYGDQQ